MCCEGSESGEPLSPSLLSFVCLCALAASPLPILPPGGGFLWPSIPAWWSSSHSLHTLHLAPARKGCWMWSPDLCPGPPHPPAKASGVGFLCFYQAWLGEGQLCSIWGLQLHLLTPFDPEVLPVGENVCGGWAAPCTCVGGMPWLAYLGLQALSVLGGLTQAGLHPGFSQHRWGDRYPLCLHLELWHRTPWPGSDGSSVPLLCVFRGAAASRGRGPFLPVPALPVIRHIVGTLGQSPFTCLPANPVITEQTGAQEGRGPVQPLQPLQPAHFPVCSGAAQGTGPVWREDGRAVRSGLTSQFSRWLMPITRTEATCSAANEEQQIKSMWLFFSFLFNTRVGVFPLQRLCLLGSS